MHKINRKALLPCIGITNSVIFLTNDCYYVDTYKFNETRFIIIIKNAFSSERFFFENFSLRLHTRRIENQ